MRRIFICLATYLIGLVSGISQTVDLNFELNSRQVLYDGIELIKKNKIEEGDKIIRHYLGTQKAIHEKVSACYKVAIAYNNHLYYNMSLEYAKEGIAYLDTSMYLLAELNHVIIINHLDLKNYDLAEEYCNNINQLYPKKKQVEANEFNLIAEVYRLNKKFKRSLLYYHQAIKINQSGSYKESLAINYNNIGLSHLYLNNADSTIYYLDQSLLLINELNLITRQSAINNSYGELYLKMGKYKTALNYFEKTITFDLSNHPDQYEVYLDAYKGMKNCYELAEDYQNALLSYIKYQEYKDRIIDSKQNTSVLQKQLLTDRKTHSKALSLITSKLELETMYKRITLLALAAIILIIILIIYIYRMTIRRVKQKVELELIKNRNQELEIEKMKLSQVQLESELIQSKQSQKIKKLERVRLEEQIQFKNRELTSTAIHVMTKNEILSKIQEKITQIDITVNEPTRKTYKEINYLISDSLRFDDDWQVFKKHFTDVHPHFFEKLKTDYPTITTDELKLCAYLKIQLSSKEIARLINITVAAVNKRRNRLRKKLDISASEDFHGFFLRIRL